MLKSLDKDSEYKNQFELFSLVIKLLCLWQYCKAIDGNSYGYFIEAAVAEGGTLPYSLHTHTPQDLLRPITHALCTHHMKKEAQGSKHYRQSKVLVFHTSRQV